MVAAIVAIDGAALETGNTAGKDRRVAKARRPLDAGEFVAGRFGEFDASACCDAPRTLTVKWLAFWKMVRPCENMPRLHSTSGGFSDTEAKELQVTP